MHNGPEPRLGIARYVKDGALRTWNERQAEEAWTSAQGMRQARLMLRGPLRWDFPATSSVCDQQLRPQNLWLRLTVNVKYNVFCIKVFYYGMIWLPIGGLDEIYSHTRKTANTRHCKQIIKSPLLVVLLDVTAGRKRWTSLGNPTLKKTLHPIKYPNMELRN